MRSDILEFYQYFKWNSQKVIIFVNGLSFCWLINKVARRINCQFELRKSWIEWVGNLKAWSWKKLIEITTWTESHELWKLLHIILHFVWQSFWKPWPKWNFVAVYKEKRKRSSSTGNNWIFQSCYSISSAPSQQWIYQYDPFYVETDK